MAEITGNTYPVKDKLKELGGRWDADGKIWTVPDDKAEEARALVLAAPRAQSKPYRPQVCKICGVRASQYTRIYKSGECNSCFRDRQDD